LFSGKNLITNRHGHLSNKVIEAIEYLYMKSWWKAGLILDKPLAEAEKMLKDLE